MLHVMANESFAEFATKLQKEIEGATGVKFGIIQLGLFTGLTYTDEVKTEKKITRSDAELLVAYLENKGLISSDTDKPMTATAADKQAVVENVTVEELPPDVQATAPTLAPVLVQAITTSSVTPSDSRYGDGVNTDMPDVTTGKQKAVETITNATYTATTTTEKTVSYDDSKELIEHFEQKGYISKSGKIKDTMKEALLNGTLDLPQKFEAARERFETIIKKADTRPPIRDASKDVMVKLNKQVLLSPEFMEIWERIKHKTVYRVNVNQDTLKEQCIKALRELDTIPKARIVTRTANFNIDNPGVGFVETSTKTLDIDDGSAKLPDFLRTVDNEFFISQRLYVDMLLESGRAKDFLNNPQLMTERFIETIQTKLHSMEIDGISYKKLDGEEYYLQEIFDSEELLANLDKNAIAVKNNERSVYDHIMYDPNSTTVEKPFAVALNNDPEVRMFFKIPSKFKIETPIGTYNPDGAVYLDRNGEQKLYFIIET